MPILLHWLLFGAAGRPLAPLMLLYLGFEATVLRGSLFPSAVAVLPRVALVAFGAVFGLVCGSCLFVAGPVTFCFGFVVVVLRLANCFGVGFALPVFLDLLCLFV